MIKMPARKNSCRRLLIMSHCKKLVKMKNQSATKLRLSTCSDEATLLGGGQKVISYSLFLSPKYNKSLAESPYFRGVLANLKGMKEFYPGWVMRLYSNISLNKDMCDLVCSDEDLYYCDVSQLPQLGDVRKLHPMTWRFLLIGDPTVEKFVVRDLDGRLTQRERDAVAEWEASDFEFHGMRDHPRHISVIMGGLWGANNYKLCIDVGTTLRKQLMEPANEDMNDQGIIADVIYDKYKQRILTHASYSCDKFNPSPSVPFPSKRHDHEFVGQPYLRGFNYKKLPRPCPIKCRPKHGRDWEYC